MWTGQDGNNDRRCGINPALMSDKSPVVNTTNQFYLSASLSAWKILNQRDFEKPTHNLVVSDTALIVLYLRISKRQDVPKIDMRYRRLERPNSCSQDQEFKRAG